MIKCYENDSENPRLKLELNLKLISSDREFNKYFILFNYATEHTTQEGFHL